MAQSAKARRRQWMMRPTAAKNAAAMAGFLGNDCGNILAVVDSSEELCKIPPAFAFVTDAPPRALKARIDRQRQVEDVEDPWIGPPALRRHDSARFASRGRPGIGGHGA